MSSCKFLRTTGTAFSGYSSVPSLLRCLAPKYPVGEGRISENHGCDNDCSGEQENLAQTRAGRAPDGNAKWHNHWKHKDRKTCNAGSNHHHACGQGTNVGTFPDTVKQNESGNQQCAAYYSKQQRAGLPCSLNARLNKKREPCNDEEGEKKERQCDAQRPH